MLFFRIFFFEIFFEKIPKRRQFFFFSYFSHTECTKIIYFTYKKKFSELTLKEIEKKNVVKKKRNYILSIHSFNMKVSGLMEKFNNQVLSGLTNNFFSFKKQLSLFDTRLFFFLFFRKNAKNLFYSKYFL